MTIKLSEEELKEQYYYHCSFLICHDILQMWINKTEGNILLRRRETNEFFLLEEKEIHTLAMELQTANNIFFQRKVEAERKEKVND